LEFVETTTGDAQEGKKLPLVVAIHGRGDSPEHFVRLFDELPVSARVIVPRAPVAYGRGGSWFSGEPMDSDTTEMLAGIRGSAGRLSRLIARHKRSRETCGNPVIVGYSQGAVLSLTLAVLHADAVGEVIFAAGWLPPSLWPATFTGVPPPVVALHGRDDRLLPAAEARAGIAHLRDVGFDATWREYAAGHALSPEMRRDFRRAIARAVQRACPDSRATERIHTGR